MMRTTMNLKAMMEGKVKLDEKAIVALGDDVEVGEGEEKREGVVKVPNGPGDTVGVLIDGELEMCHEEEISRKVEEAADHKTAFDTGYAKSKVGGMQRDAAFDEFCDGQDSEDMRGAFDAGWFAARDSAVSQTDAFERFREENLLKEGVLGMTMMPSLSRMQQLAGIKVAAPEREDEAPEEGCDPEDAGCDEPKVERSEQEAEPFEPAEVGVPETGTVANHPTAAVAVQMMSAPVEPDPFPETEEPECDESECNPLQACNDALATIERNLPDISVKDFSAVQKRMTELLNSLFEGATGRRKK